MDGTAILTRSAIDDEQRAATEELRTYARVTSGLPPGSIGEIQVELVPAGNLEAAERFFRCLLSSPARTLYVGDLKLYFGSVLEGRTSLLLLERAGFQIFQDVRSAVDARYSGELHAVIEAVLGLEKTYRQARLSVGRERNAKRGGRHGGNPSYGELLGEAAVLERIKRQHDEGLGHTDIASRLNADSVKPRNGKKWYPAVIANILGVRRDAKKRLAQRKDKIARSTNEASNAAEDNLNRSFDP